MVQTATFEKPTTGAFTLDLYREALEQVHEHNAVLTFTVSNGEDERIFFFTRGAILFLAVGATGGEVLARKIVARKLLPQSKVDALMKRANADVPLLQDLIQSEGLLAPDLLKTVVEETIEDHLVEVAFWDGLYDVIPGNPPPRIYDKDVPAVRLSVGLKPLLARVRPRVNEAPAVLASLGGSLRNRVTRAAALSGQLAEEERALIEAIGETPRTIREVLARAAQRGIPPASAAGTLASLVRSRAVSLETVERQVSAEEERAVAQRIEGSFEGFVNRLLARSHLARIYEHVGEAEKAAVQYRGIADEHLARNNVEGGLAALRAVLRFAPQDLEVRELVVKVLQGAGRLGEAAREAVDLGRLLISVGLPGRARSAFELALKLVPGSLGVLWMLGGLLGALGYTEDAVKVYEEIAELSTAAGDEKGAIAALQEIVAIDPLNERALAALERYSGYAKALVIRYATAGIAVAVLAAVLAYGVYEILALRDWKEVRDEQIWPRVDERKFDVAREAAVGHARRWSLSWTATLARALKVRIDEEEAAVREQTIAQEMRTARKLDQEGKVPEALEHWRRARETTSPERQKLALAAIAQDEERIERVNGIVLEAKKLGTARALERAHALYTQALENGPWLLGTADWKVPVRIDSVPRGARVWDGDVALPDPTPLTTERLLAPGTVRFEARGREPWVQPLEALPPWPMVAFLPLRAAWRVDSVAASAAPLLAKGFVIAASDDRTAVCVARDDGARRWSHVLGVFGETELPPVLVGQDLVALRTTSGEVVALELTTGNERWRHAVALPPVGLDPLGATPVGTPEGVVVREGARGLVLLAAKDGAPVWSVAARSDPEGAPAVSGDRAALQCGRLVEGFELADGQSRWAPRLSGVGTTSVGSVGGGSFAVAMEPDDVLRIDRSGSIVWTARAVTGARASTPPVGNATLTLVGTSQGEVVALDAKGQLAWRARTGFERPIRSLVLVDQDLVLAGDEGALCAFDSKGQSLWQHPCAGATPAVGDERRVYQGGVRGLEAFDR